MKQPHCHYIAINWLQVVPNMFILKSSSDLDKWYSRLKSVLRDNMFYMIKINLSTEEYTGWLEMGLDKKEYSSKPNLVRPQGYQLLSIEDKQYRLLNPF